MRMAARKAGVSMPGTEEPMLAEATATQRILSERTAARRAAGLGKRPGAARKGPRPVVPVALPAGEDFPTNPELVRLRTHKRHTVDGRVRAATIGRGYLTKEERELSAALDATTDEFPPMPTTRAGCADVPRPCPYVRCKHNLYLSIIDSGNIKIHDPTIDPHEVSPRHSCALDLVDANPDGLVLEACGEILNITRERIRQIEVRALAKARKNVVVSLDGDRTHQAD